MFAALRFAIVSVRTSLRGVAYGQTEMPEDPDDFIMFRPCSSRCSPAPTGADRPRIQRRLPDVPSVTRGAECDTLPGVSRLDDLRRVELALTRIARINNGRIAARHRSERSGVMLREPPSRSSRPCGARVRSGCRCLPGSPTSRPPSSAARSASSSRVATSGARPTRPTGGRASSISPPRSPRPGLPRRHRRDHRRDLRIVVGLRSARAAPAARPGRRGLRPPPRAGRARLPVPAERRRRPPSTPPTQVTRLGDVRRP